MKDIMTTQCFLNTAYVMFTLTHSLEHILSLAYVAGMVPGGQMRSP